MKFLFDVYDSAGGLNIDTVGTVVFDTARYLIGECSLDSGEITVNPISTVILPDNNYLVFISSRVSTDISTGTNRSDSKIWLEMDTGSGFSVIEGTYAYIYNRTSGQGKGSAAICTTVEVPKLTSFKIRVRAQRESGSSNIQTMAGASNLIGFINE